MPPTTVYGDYPSVVGHHPDLDLREVMYYLYLPVFMDGEFRRPSVGTNLKVPRNVECCLPLILDALEASGRPYRYVYLSARKGWATPDNPLNRPGWHCDGFGTDDLNFVWWKGPGTRFLIGNFTGISDDHVESLHQFEMLAHQNAAGIYRPRTEGTLLRLSTTCIHATPEITEGCMRQYVKVSLSDHQYNLENNSHNYLFDYDWPMHRRETVRNDTTAAQKDYG